MEQYSKVKRQESAELEKRLNDLADFFRNEGKIQVFVVAMAAVIQREMTHHQTKGTLPHSDAVDLIMRAVEHTLRGDPNMHSYVLDKLNLGTRCLNKWMTEQQPST